MGIFLGINCHMPPASVSSLPALLRLDCIKGRSERKRHFCIRSADVVSTRGGMEPELRAAGVRERLGGGEAHCLWVCPSAPG